jgi:hypothetical protein
MGGRVIIFYRVDHFFPASWFMLGGHHDDIYSAREYLAKQLLIDDAIRKEKPWTPRGKYRITDHLGAVHWPEERKAA